MIVITGEALTLFLMPTKICIVLLRQLLNVLDEILCDEQAGFLHGRSNCDMLFVKHNIIEHCFQFQWPVMINFIDSQKSFGQHIYRGLGWKLSETMALPNNLSTFLESVPEFHLLCCVRIDKDTRFFSIITEVQDCVLSQFLFLLNMHENSHKLIELWNSIER